MGRLLSIILIKKVILSVNSVYILQYTVNSNGQSQIIKLIVLTNYSKHHILCFELSDNLKPETTPTLKGSYLMC